MYFPIGAPKYFNARVADVGWPLALRFNRTRQLFAIISNDAVMLWKTMPRLLVSLWRRDSTSLLEHGNNQDLAWKPDSTSLCIVTHLGYLIFLDVATVSGEFIYHLHETSFAYDVEQLEAGGVPKIKLAQTSVVNVNCYITSISPRASEVVVATSNGWLQRVQWNGTIQKATAVYVRRIVFYADLETVSGAPLTGDNVHIVALECSPLLSGFSFVLSDGRAGYIYASSAVAEPSELKGLLAKDITNALCVSVNHKYQFVVYGCENGQGYAYGFDESTGALVVSHKYSLPTKDYPDQGRSAGKVISMAWTPDCCAMAMLWSKAGVAVWSVFGSLLMCSLDAAFCVSPDAFHLDPLAVRSMGWTPEGYHLILLPAQESVDYNVIAGDVIQVNFVKSALSVNPCMANHYHLFLQGESSLYVNLGDNVLQGAHTREEMERYSHLYGGKTASFSMLFRNKHWQTIQVPSNYIGINWPIRYSAIDSLGKYLAVAGKFGYAHYSFSARKWKMFGNMTQEQGVSCRGGMTWWNEFLVVAVYNLDEDVDEIRFHPRKCNLDVNFARVLEMAAPIFLVNVFQNVLLVYGADCKVHFYGLHTDSESSVPSVLTTKISETSLIDYVPHPVAVTLVSLTALKTEQATIGINVEGREAHSLLASVGGKLMMLQKDKPASELRSRKVQFLSPVILASCVENVWYASKQGSEKRHLTESLWLGCGAHGMKAWLPLYPAKEGMKSLSFLSKRIMLHFDLQVHPLAVLFEDAVILGVSSDNMADGASPVLPGGGKLAFPFFSLERTTQVYLPHILRQLLRRNLGIHALEIARSCTKLPYFTHVLELMLHEVLEKEATASEPIPDPLLPRIVAFIQEFPQYLETVCHCARKTEVALWPHLFSVVGNPIDLFTECHTSSKLETAASYLIIIQNLEPPSVSRQHATLLLELALDSGLWELSKDLVRFLRVIGKGEDESPPRTPLHCKSFHSTLASSSAVEEDVSPVSVPFSKTLTRTNSVGIIHPRTGSASIFLAEAGRQGSHILNRHGSLSPTGSCGVKSKPTTETQQVSSLASRERPLRPSNLKFARSTSFAYDRKVPPSPTKPVTLESCEQFFTELILSRHARKLLSSAHLRDLGRFAAYLDFDLVSWLTKERFRAAQIDDFLEVLLMMHREFDWPFPSSSACSRMSGTSSKISYQRFDHGELNELQRQNSSAPRTPGENQTEDENPAHMAREIQAKLAALRADDVSSLGGTEYSENSSMAQSLEELDVIEGSTWVNNGPELANFEDVSKMVTRHGSKKSHKEISYLMNIFMEARCIDWYIILGLMVGDLSSLSTLIEKAMTFRDLTRERIDHLQEQLALLETWAEQQGSGYQALVSCVRSKSEALQLATLEEEHQDPAPPAPCEESAISDTSTEAPAGNNEGEDKGTEVPASAEEALEQGDDVEAEGNECAVS